MDGWGNAEVFLLRTLSRASSPATGSGLRRLVSGTRVDSPILSSLRYR